MIGYDNGDVFVGGLDFFKQPHGRGLYEHRPRIDQIQPGKYDGNWKHGHKHGKGTHKYTNGDVYRGLWIKDKRDTSNNKKDNSNNSSDTSESENAGSNSNTDTLDEEENYSKSTYVYYQRDPTQHVSQKFVGDWKDNKRHGRGVMIFTNGDKYKGHWKDGEMETLQGETATYTFRDGSKYVGKYDVYFDSSYYE